MIRVHVKEVKSDYMAGVGAYMILKTTIADGDLSLDYDMYLSKSDGYTDKMILKTAEEHVAYVRK